MTSGRLPVEAILSMPGAMGAKWRTIRPTGVMSSPSITYTNCRWDNHQFLSSGLLGHVVGNWQISGIWSFMTGTHFSPTLATGVTNTAEARPVQQRLGTARTALWAAATSPRASARSTGGSNVGTFSIPQTYTFGNCGAYILQGPGYFNADLGVHRSFSVTERVRLTFRWEMFNSFNHVNFSNPNAQIGSSSAGQISSTQPARSMQFALKALF